jgi:hypothetical protein
MAFEPDANLIKLYAIKYRWNEEKLRDVFWRFGPLSDDVQEKVAHRLVGAFASFQSLGRNFQRIPTAAIDRRIEAVETNTRKVLRTLGINVHHIDWRMFDEPFANRPASWRLDVLYSCRHGHGTAVEGRQALLRLAFAGVDMTRRDDPVQREAINTKAQRNDERVAEAVLGLIWFYKQAEAARIALDARPRAGPGGAANRITAKGRLIDEAIRIFVDMTKSGHGGPLHRFVHSVASLFGTQVTDTQIDNSWRNHLRRKQKKKDCSLP